MAYREAIEYIAMNDEPTFLDPETLTGFPSVQVVAIIYKKTYERVAQDVVKFRIKHLGEGRHDV